MLSPGLDAAIEDVPQLRALVLGIPLAQTVAEGEDALLGAGFLLVAPRSTESGIVVAFAQRVEQGLGLEQSAAALRAQPERIGPRFERGSVGMDDQLDPSSAAKLSRNSIISLNL